MKKIITPSILLLIIATVLISCSKPSFTVKDVEIGYLDKSDTLTINFTLADFKPEVPEKFIKKLKKSRANVYIHLYTEDYYYLYIYPNDFSMVSNIKEDDKGIITYSFSEEGFTEARPNIDWNFLAGRTVKDFELRFDKAALENVDISSFSKPLMLMLNHGITGMSNSERKKIAHTEKLKQYYRKGWERLRGMVEDDGKDLLKSFTTLGIAIGMNGKNTEEEKDWFLDGASDYYKYRQGKISGPKY